MSISFTVVGNPIGQGSKRAFRRPDGSIAMTEGATAEAAKRHKSWRVEMAEAAAAVAPPEPLGGPVYVSLDFLFLPGTTARFRHYHVVAPDADKLARAALDALKVGRLIVDDSRVAQLFVTKRYCASGESPGVRVRVMDLSAEEADERAERKAAAAALRKAARDAALLERHEPVRVVPS